MNTNKFKTAVLFCGALTAVGGAERLTFEEAKYFEKKGIKTYILAYDFNEEVLFDKNYNPNIEKIGVDNKKNIIFRILTLRKKIKEIKPDIIISDTALSSIYLYFATSFTPFSYVTHIHGTIFWFDTLPLKYAIIHKKVFNEIRESVAGHKEFTHPKPPKLSLTQRISLELTAIAMYMAVRKAKKIFVLSNQMRWEVEKLYGKEAMVLKGAFPSEILNYKQKLNIKERLGLTDKRMILNVNRLDPRKRVDLLIKAFKQIYDKFNDVVLVIGGVGPEEENLRALVKELNIEDRVKFVGYIKEEELWDYLASCDVFAHPNWADFAIAAYEPLALQKKVAWSTEMEIDEFLAENRHIFAANPTVNDFAEAIEKALTTEVTEKNDLSNYTWDRYSDHILSHLSEYLYV